MAKAPKAPKTGLTKKHWFGYMFGDWGGCMTFALMGSLFTMYCTNALGIDTTLLGDHIRRGGNPSNDPMWNESYLWRNIHALHSTKSNCAVIGYAIAKGKTSGINIYDTYLLLKQLSPNHLVIYEGAAGEWATDKH